MFLFIFLSVEITHVYNEMYSFFGASRFDKSSLYRFLACHSKAPANEPSTHEHGGPHITSTWPAGQGDSRSPDASGCGLWRSEALFLAHQGIDGTVRPTFCRASTLQPPTRSLLTVCSRSDRPSRIWPSTVPSPSFVPMRTTMPLTLTKTVGTTLLNL
jgi:hypothetical protein